MKNLSIICVESQINEPSNIYARFKIGPFQKKYTLTIANNLRRALLSELSGLAITAVKIEGVSHEYTSLKGVRESVLDILLNIKRISLTSDMTILTPFTASCEMRGPGKVKAGDIIFPSYIKCVDPDQHIASLCEDGKLEIIFFICPGKDYWVQFSSDELQKYCTEFFPENKNSEKNYLDFFQTSSKLSNILTIDPVFMPIRRVNYTIEVDEDIDTEHPEEYIFLEIWGNGTIHPFRAIQLAIRAMIDIFEPLKALKPTPSLFLNPKIIKRKTTKKKTRTDAFKLRQSMKILDIGNLDLSLRPYTCLKRAKIETIGDLLRYSKEELLSLKNFGKRSLEEVQNSLFQMGLGLKKKIQQKSRVKVK